MPELPEVETMVRGLRPHVTGRTVTAFRRCRCRRKPISIRPGFPQISRRVVGNAITGVRRLAKRVVVELSSGDALAVEPRMTGLMLLADPPSREHLRLEWELSGDGEFSKFWFWDRRGLGTVRLYRPEELETELGPERVGPDALSLAEADWLELCSNTNRAIKVAMLDQKWIAGIGNLYASEILHAAGIHPENRTPELTPEEVQRLAAASLDILNDAIRYEGSTLNDFTYRNALNRNGRYQSKHRVYRREGERCITCSRGTIERIVQAQRSTFFCPWCQPVR